MIKEQKAGCQDSASVSGLCRGGVHCLFCRGRVGVRKADGARDGEGLAE